MACEVNCICGTQFSNCFYLHQIGTCVLAVDVHKVQFKRVSGTHKHPQKHTWAEILESQCSGDLERKSSGELTFEFVILLAL